MIHIMKKLKIKTKKKLPNHLIQMIHVMKNYKWRNNRKNFQTTSNICIWHYKLPTNGMPVNWYHKEGTIHYIFYGK